MTKFLVLSISLFSAASFARECKVADVQNYFSIYPKVSIDSFCRDQGGEVASISATGAGGILNSDPSTAVGNYVIKCENGELLVGTLYLDAATCRGKTATTERTVQIYSK